MAATAVRVFGKPITDGTRTQRALAAKNYQNADGKLDQVLQVSSPSQKVGVVATVSTTFGRIYNATGQTVTYVTAYDWEGNVCGQYPVKIHNGQWAVFEHVANSRTHRKGSVAAVVYNIEDCCDILIAWNNPWKTSGENNNTAYCEMNVPGHYNKGHWDTIHKKLLHSGTQSHAKWEGYATKVCIQAGGNTPTFTAFFHLDV